MVNRNCSANSISIFQDGTGLDGPPPGRSKGGSRWEIPEGDPQGNHPGESPTGISQGNPPGGSPKEIPQKDPPGDHPGGMLGVS
jgi:hypothetical protein